MRTDRELLELAAKAAGYREFQYCETSGGLQAIYIDDDNVGFWTPLTDDGDALRLAVKLHIQIGILSNPEVWAQFYRADDKATGWITIKEPTRGDPTAATRRAIVRAAAEVGALAHPKQHNDGGADGL